jgi:RNA-directed DNA polymerase
MLAALIEGVKGGKWYSLIDKVYPEAALRLAFTQVAANRGAAGVDHVTIAKYASDLDANLARQSEALRSGTYRPQRIRRHYIPKLGSREKRPPRDKPVGRKAHGDTDGPRPGGADGAAHGAEADL